MHIGNTKAWVGTNTVRELLTGSYPIPVSKGGTGVTSISGLKDSLGISSSSGISNIEYKSIELLGDDAIYIKTTTVTFSFTIKAAIIAWWVSGNKIDDYGYINHIDILTTERASIIDFNYYTDFELSDKTIKLFHHIDKYSRYGFFQIVAFG